MSEYKAWEVVVLEGVRILAFVDTIKEEFFDKAKKDVEDKERDGDDADNVISDE